MMKQHYVHDLLPLNIFKQRVSLNQQLDTELETLTKIFIVIVLIIIMLLKLLYVQNTSVQP
jgi:hypothetical protein